MRTLKGLGFGAWGLGFGAEPSSAQQSLPLSASLPPCLPSDRSFCGQPMQKRRTLSILACVARERGSKRASRSDIGEETEGEFAVPERCLRKLGRAPGLGPEAQPHGKAEGDAALDRRYPLDRELVKAELLLDSVREAVPNEQFPPMRAAHHRCIARQLQLLKSVCTLAKVAARVPVHSRHSRAALDKEDAGSDVATIP